MSDNRIYHSLSLDGKDLIFRIDHPYAKSWFLPRYAAGELHEPLVTKHLLERLNKVDTFLDIGSHLGYFAIAAAAYCTTVYAVELQRCLAPLISANIDANNFKNVFLFNVAAGQEAGTARYQADQFSASMTVDGPGALDIVPMLSIDELMADVESVGPIKIDVEGFEGSVLCGAEHTLRRGRPPLFLECHRAAERWGWSYDKILTLVESFGYVLYLYTDHRSAGQSLSRITSSDAKMLGDNVMLLCEPR